MTTRIWFKGNIWYIDLYSKQKIVMSRVNYIDGLDIHKQELEISLDDLSKCEYDIMLNSFLEDMYSWHIHEKDILRHEKDGLEWEMCYGEYNLNKKDHYGFYLKREDKIKSLSKEIARDYEVVGNIYEGKMNKNKY